MDDKVVTNGYLLPGIKRLSRGLHRQCCGKKIDIVSRFSMFGRVTG